MNNLCFGRENPAVSGTSDSAQTSISILEKHLQSSFVVQCDGSEIIFDDGTHLNSNMISSDVLNRINFSAFLSLMVSESSEFFYCDGYSLLIQSFDEKIILEKMVGCLAGNKQLIYTANNLDVLDFNFPKHSYAFLFKKKGNVENDVSVFFASDLAQRSLSSVRSALESDSFFYFS